MERGSPSDLFAVLLVAVAATLLFLAAGLWLNRRHRLRRRSGAALLWVLLTLAPLLGAGLLSQGGAAFDRARAGGDQARAGGR